MAKNNDSTVILLALLGVGGYLWFKNQSAVSNPPPASGSGVSTPTNPYPTGATGAPAPAGTTGAPGISSGSLLSSIKNLLNPGAQSLVTSQVPALNAPVLGAPQYESVYTGGASDAPTDPFANLDAPVLSYDSTNIAGVNGAKKRYLEEDD